MKTIILIICFFVANAFYGQSKIKIYNLSNGATIYLTAVANSAANTSCYPTYKTINRSPGNVSGYYTFSGTTDPAGASYEIEEFTGFGSASYNEYLMSLTPTQVTNIPATIVELTTGNNYDWYQFGIKVQDGYGYDNTYGSWLSLEDDPCTPQWMRQSWEQPTNNPVSFGLMYKLGNEIVIVVYDTL